jgi:hypothetical protein
MFFPTFLLAKLTQGSKWGKIELQSPERQSFIMGGPLRDGAASI